MKESKTDDKEIKKKNKFFDKKGFKEFYSIPIVFILCWMIVLYYWEFDREPKTFVSLFTICAEFIASIIGVIVSMAPPLVVLYFFSYLVYRKNKTKRNIFFNRLVLSIVIIFFYGFLKQFK